MKLDENRELNNKEFLQGKTILKSYPLRLGIDIEGRCNFKPSCVYCNFDKDKLQEGEFANVNFNKETLKELGPFFQNSKQLTNCSIGEPFLSKDIINLLETFEKEGKYLEMSTNGLLLNKRNRDALLGKNISLYISLDAATKETFAKLRNQYFEKIIDNVRKLSKEKQKFNGLPRIYMVFMPMKVNLHELEGFVKLCADLKVDKMILRSLVYEHQYLKTKRNGHEFVYKNEILSYDTLQNVYEKAKKFAKKYRINLKSQLDFGVISTSKKNEEIPICDEPWRVHYILRQGIKPCCYGYSPIAEMNDFKKTWNGKKIQNIREHLAKGKLSDYCLQSRSCPIVKNYLKEHPDYIGFWRALKIRTYDFLIFIYRKFRLYRFKKYLIVFVR